ncbi:response regulator [Candidatus Woesearchaeota archaeon]|nr:response regulator [Candidatus Woesearchaeota archaeon]
MKKILYAEDEDANYLLISAYLNGSYCLHRAKTGFEAIDLAQLLSLDFILMDIKMPELDGIEATKCIREFNTTIPVVACTADVYSLRDNDLIHNLFTDYLSKPVTKEVFFQLLDRYLK